MYKEHPVYLDPDNMSNKLWRYMDFTKFISMIQNKSLYFSTVDSFEDKFEGTFPFKEVEYQKKHGNWEAVSSGSAYSKKICFVNCWHYNQNESAGMWKLYSQLGKGIAIQTTIPRFKEAFKSVKEDIFIGKVIYIDYDTDTFYHGEKKGYPSLNLGVPFIHKRNIFIDEKEYRALKIVHDSSIENQNLVQVDLDILIESVIVSPGSEEGFFKLTESMLKQILPNKSVSYSSHDKKPY